MRVIMTGGCSGGHVYPAIAIADKIREKEPDAEILYIGNDVGIEKDIVSDLGYELKMVPARWLDRSGGRLHKGLELAKTGFVTARGVAGAYKIMKKFKPDVVIGTGGFVCVPVVFAGHLYGAKTFLHEQNAFPGKANRFLSKFVDNVFLGFDQARDSFDDKSKLITVGNPVRKDFFDVDKAEARRALGLPEDDFVIFSFGGSQGAESINKVSLELMKSVNNKKGISFIFGTGSLYYEIVEELLEKEHIEPGFNVHVKPYIKDMPNHIAAADLIIARAGALSLAEITVCGKPSILIPLSTAADNHQYYNALSIAERGGAYLVDERSMNLDQIMEYIDTLASDREKLEAMGKAAGECGVYDATDKIYDEIKKRVR